MHAYNIKKRTEVWDAQLFRWIWIKFCVKYYIWIVWPDDIVKISENAYHDVSDSSSSRYTHQYFVFNKNVNSLFRIHYLESKDQYSL